jgi:hypothetical protein
MDESVPFMARCPKCGYEWLQDGYTRHTLLSLLHTKSNIEAYCVRCAVLWPISTQEQQALRAQLAPESLWMRPPRGRTRSAP